MIKKNLMFSLLFLVAALVGGLVLGFELWLNMAPAPTVDGIIAEHEYAQTLEDDLTGMGMSWSIVGDKIYVALRSPGQGWLGVGFDPDDAVSTMMLGADIIMGYVQEGEIFIEDQYGNTKVSHRRDPRGEGTDDVLSSAGSESAEGTILEFSRLLITEDERDKPIQRGKVFVELAYAVDDDLYAYHNELRNTVRVDFFEGGVAGGIEHLEAYQVAVLIWCFLFGLLGIQGLVSTYLEGNVTQAVRHPADVPAWPMLLYPFAFMVITIWASWMFVQILIQGENPSLLGQFAALLMFMLANLVGFYRRYFMDDVVIEQQRKDGVPW